MHPVHISICCNNDILIPESVQPVLYIQRMLQEIKFFVFINHLF